MEELSLYNGTHEGLPILLAILGYLCFSLPSSHVPTFPCPRLVLIIRYLITVRKGNCDMINKLKLKHTVTQHTFVLILQMKFSVNSSVLS